MTSNPSKRKSLDSLFEEQEEECEKGAEYALGRAKSKCSGYITTQLHLFLYLYLFVFIFVFLFAFYLCLYLCVVFVFVFVFEKEGE